MAKKAEQPAEKKSPRFANKRAWHDYHILETLECGITLAGTEVKSLRAGNARIDEAFARIRGGEVFLVGANIGAYTHADPRMQHDPTRDRKLLLHRRQIETLETHVRQKGKTIVLLALYFKNGWAKCELGIAEGKKAHDKRDALRKRDQQREIAREMNRRR